MGLESIYREVHPKARVETLDGTVGEFFTDHLSKNRR